MNHDVSVLIGRFQPFHEGHFSLIASALERADRLLLLLGSHRCAPDTRNPRSSEERERMIRAALPADWHSDNLWLAEVQQKVLAATDEEDRVLLVGHRKDRSSYYLALFPQWDFQDVPLNSDVHSTAIRQAYFSGGDDSQWASHVPEAVRAFLTEYRETGRYRWLRQEADYIAGYRQLWSVAPYPPTFVTTDAVVVQSGHVLVVRRRVRPGQGLIALPGGYLNQKEMVVEGMLRELREETGLKVPKPVLEGSIADRHVFDAPGRSQRGRVITHAFLIQLKGGVLPSVRGGDDAEKAFWMPLADIYAHEDTFFEDHVQIIQHFISRL